ncbi:YndM family protein [Oceanobacillus saliphilus]|uniref:YndM family protein n=1 Tax=Oceanobacillus saliphilus TaxID=2925834 RepID=UPI00201E53BD|nr:YndM family protein [Oceanobacillus saliphilus]
MKHTGPLAIKFLMTTAILWIVLGLFFDMSFGNIITTSLIVTLLGYLGDLFIMPRVGNVFASIADFVFFWAAVWIVANTIIQTPIIALGTAAFISAVLLTIGEAIFHKYLKEEEIKYKKHLESKIAYFPRKYQTEFSSEMNENDGMPPKDTK